MAESFSQVEFDLKQFPVTVPPDPAKVAAAAKKKKPPAAKKVTKADLAALDELSSSKRHETEAAEKADIVRKVKKYVQTFGDKIDYKVPRGFGSKQTLAELQDVLHNVERDLNTQGGTEYACQLFTTVMGGLQDASPFLPFKLQLSGPVCDIKGTLAAQEEVWVPMIKEFSIKYESYFAVGVERRLLFFCATLVTQVHRGNTAQHDLKGKGENPPPQGFAEADLDAMLHP